MPGSRGSGRSWLVLAGALLLALAQPVATVAWTPDTFSATSEAALLRLTNETRSAAGLQALPTDAVLALEARWRSRDMIERGYFSHDIPPDGHRYAHELSAMGYCFVRAGENIGWNVYPDASATSEIHAAFLASASHRLAILQPDWDAIGIGAYQGRGEQKMWTVLFAQRCPAATAPPTVAAPGDAVAVVNAPASSPAISPAPTTSLATMLRDLARSVVRLAVPLGTWRA